MALGNAHNLTNHKVSTCGNANEVGTSIVGSKLRLRAHPKRVSTLMYHYKARIFKYTLINMHTHTHACMYAFTHVCRPACTSVTPRISALRVRLAPQIQFHSHGLLAMLLLLLLRMAHALAAAITNGCISTCICVRFSYCGRWCRGVRRRVVCGDRVRGFKRE